MKKYIRTGIPVVGWVVFLFLLAACNGATQASNTSESAESHNLIVSHAQTANHPIQTKVFNGLAEDLIEETDGRLTLEFYPSNTLGDAGSQYDMAVTREADIALSVHGYSPGRFPLVTVMEMPFLVESAEHGSEILMHLYKEFPELQEEHADTHPLFLYTSEPSQLISKDIKIESPEDMQGLRVRSPSPVGNEILETLGATPISMPMNDVYEALDRGIIDAALVSYEPLYGFALHEVANYITIGDFSATPFFSVMNHRTFNNLSKEDQQVITDLTGIELAKKAGRAYDEDGEIGLQAAIDGGAELIYLEGELLKQWEEALEPMVEKWIVERTKEGYPAQEIYDRAMELKVELSDKQ